MKIKSLLLVITLLGLALSSCSEETNIDLRSQQEGSKAPTEMNLVVNSCSGAYKVIAPFRVGGTAIRLRNADLSYAGTVESTMTAIPEVFQELFYSMGGKIEIVGGVDLTNFCRSGLNSNEKALLGNSHRSVPACTYLDEISGEMVLLVEADHDLIRSTIVRAFGMMLSRYILNLDFSQNELVYKEHTVLRAALRHLSIEFLNEVDKKSEFDLKFYRGMVNESLLIPSQIRQVCDYPVDPKHDLFSDFVFGQAFQGYYCGENSRKKMQEANTYFHYFQSNVEPILLSMSAMKEMPSGLEISSCSKGLQLGKRKSQKSMEHKTRWKRFGAFLDRLYSGFWKQRSATKRLPGEPSTLPEEAMTDALVSDSESMGPDRAIAMGGEGSESLESGEMIQGADPMERRERGLDQDQVMEEEKAEEEKAEGEIAEEEIAEEEKAEQSYDSLPTYTNVIPSTHPSMKTSSKSAVVGVQSQHVQENESSDNSSPAPAVLDPSVNDKPSPSVKKATQPSKLDIYVEASNKPGSINKPLKDKKTQLEGKTPVANPVAQPIAEPLAQPIEEPLAVPIDPSEVKTSFSEELIQTAVANTGSVKKAPVYTAPAAVVTVSECDQACLDYIASLDAEPPVTTAAVSIAGQTNSDENPSVSSCHFSGKTYNEGFDQLYKSNSNHCKQRFSCNGGLWEKATSGGNYCRTKYSKTEGFCSFESSSQKCYLNCPSKKGGNLVGEYSARAGAKSIVPQCSSGFMGVADSCSSSGSWKNGGPKCVVENTQAPEPTTTPKDLPSQQNERCLASFPNMLGSSFSAAAGEQSITPLCISGYSGVKGFCNAEGQWASEPKCIKSK